MLHDPVLIINTDGISSQHPFFRTQIKWEEIDSIYQIERKNGTVFAVNLSPTGLVSFLSRQGKGVPRRLNIAVPQLALGILDTNLPIPVDQLLAQICERFSAQLERYSINLESGQDKGQESE